MPPIRGLSGCASGTTGSRVGSTPKSGTSGATPYGLRHASSTQEGFEAPLESGNGRAKSRRREARETHLATNLATDGMKTALQEIPGGPFYLCSGDRI